MEELVIQSVKVFDTFFFMGKDLDDFLTIHHLFDITVDRCDIFLLCDKVFCTECTDLFCGKKCDTDHKKCHDCQRNI